MSVGRQAQPILRVARSLHPREPRKPPEIRSVPTPPRALHKQAPAYLQLPLILPLIRVLPWQQIDSDLQPLHSRIDIVLVAL
jgi:hypothetical protein